MPPRIETISQFEDRTSPSAPPLPVGARSARTLLTTLQTAESKSSLLAMPDVHSENPVETAGRVWQHTDERICSRRPCGIRALCATS